MKVLVSVNHPAHVHLFKHLIWQLIQDSHSVTIVARDKEITIDLLNKYGFDYSIISTAKKTPFGLMCEMFHRTKDLISIIRRLKPDISISQMDPSLAFASKLMGVPYICTADTDHATASIYGALPFSKAVLTPSCFTKKIGPKQICYNGYHELAYLHPNLFTPNPAVLTELGLAEDDLFIVVRFVSWQASHDIGQHGINDKIGLVKALEQYGRVIITSEGELPEELKKYQISVSPEKLHDLLYYATLYIGEGATTASECAVLGTHAIYVNTLRLGYTDEEEEKYDLLYTFSNPDTMETEVFEKAKKLLEDPDLRAKGKKKREQLLKEKIDVTAFMVWFIENYPESIKQLKENPDIQKNF